MDAKVEEFDREWKTGDRGKAKTLAKAYVAANRAHLLQHLEGLDIPALVAMVTAYRQAGRHEDAKVVDMWLLSEFEPQRITGSGGIEVKK